MKRISHSSILKNGRIVEQIVPNCWVSYVIATLTALGYTEIVVSDI